MTNSAAYIFPGIFSLIGAGLIFYGFNRLSKYNLIQNIPRSKIRSMAIGLVEIQGNAAGDKFVITPFSQTKALYYSYRIEEYRAHTSRDSKGNTSTSYSWDTISSGEQRIPFFGKDETGQVYVDPKGAEFNVNEKKVFLQSAGLFGSIGNIVNELKNWDNNNASSLSVSSWGLTPLDPQNHFSFGGSVGDRKYYEYYIEPEETLFIIGTAANDPNAPDNVLIRKGDGEPTFIISDKSEKDLLGSLLGQIIGCFVFGGIILIIALVFFIKMSSLI